MSIMTVFVIICIVLGVLIIVTGFLAFFDWRAFLIRRIGANYRKGLAHIQLNGVWVYRSSTLIYEGTDAMTYEREVKIGGHKAIVNDIVPNKIGFSYDEYTGERIYRVNPGGCIGYSDDGNAPAVDYPEELISVHVLDRSVSNYAASVNSEGGINWKPILIGGVIVIAVVVVLFMSGFFNFSGPATPGTENQTTTIEKTIPPGGIVTKIEDK